MSIKPDAAKYFEGHPIETELANRLDEAFDVTFRGDRGMLAFWLLDPKPIVKERFGLQQEVLALYSHHPKTDARILTTIENISRSPDFRHRIDKVLFLLIHCGTNEQADALVANSIDRVIVPIHDSQLQNPQRGSVFLRSTIARAIGAVDLFGMTSAITSDKYFFGRNELVQALINRATVQKENSGLFGLRKTGKTSVLRAIQRRLEDKPIHCEYFECSNPGIHAARWWHVLELISTRLFESAGAHVSAKRPPRDYSPTHAGASFSDDIKFLLKSSDSQMILLMLDEIEFITHGLSGALGQHWDSDFLPFWQTIRSTHQETSGALIFLVAGVNPACVEISHFGTAQNPIFQLATPHYLEPFTIAQVRDMVRSIGRYTGMSFKEDVFEFLESTYGGHPFLIRVACSDVWKQCDRLNPEHLVFVAKSDYDAQAQEIRARLSSPIRDILLSLVWWYPEEYDLLRILASGDAEFVNSYIKQEPKSVLRFAQYGILRKDDPTRFAISDVREFLIQFGESYKRELSPFSRGDIPPELLPKTPDLATLGRLFEKRTEIETNLRKAIVLYLGVKHTFDPEKISKSIAKSLSRRADRPNPADLFVGRPPQEAINQLYAPDLKSVIIDNWDTFGTLFDNKKQRLEMNLDTLNIARRVDTHAKPVTPEEASEFENSYNWLLSRLAKIKTM